MPWDNSGVREPGRGHRALLELFNQSLVPFFFSLKTIKYFIYRQQA